VIEKGSEVGRWEERRDVRVGTLRSDGVARAGRRSSGEIADASF